MSLKWEIIRDNLDGGKKTARAISAETNLPLTTIKSCLTFFKRQGVFGLTKDRMWYFIKEPVGRKKATYSYLLNRIKVNQYTYDRMKIIIDELKKSSCGLTRKELMEKCDTYVRLRYELEFLEINKIIFSQNRNFCEKEYFITKEPVSVKIRVLKKELELTNE